MNPSDSRRPAARPLAAAFVLSLLLCLPATTRAGGDDQLFQCLCEKTVAAVLCKDPTDFNYVGMRGPGTFVINGLYGTRHHQFDCSVRPDSATTGKLIVTSKAWLRLSRSEPYEIDTRTGQAVAEIRNSDCPSRRVVCTRKPTQSEREAAKEDAFWYRPIPEDLRQVDQLGGNDDGVEEEPPLPDSGVPGPNLE